jgi:hypothetical protein
MSDVYIAISPSNYALKDIYIKRSERLKTNLGNNPEK